MGKRPKSRVGPARQRAAESGSDTPGPPGPPLRGEVSGMTFFSPVNTWDISEPAFASAIAELANDGARQCEGVALWLGQRGHGHATVTHLVVLRSPEVVRRPDLLVIPSTVFNDVTD